MANVHVHAGIRIEFVGKCPLCNRTRTECVKVGDVVRLWNEDAGWYGEGPIRVTKMRKAPRVMFKCWGDYINEAASVWFTLECVGEVNGVEIEW